MLYIRSRIIQQILFLSALILLSGCATTLTLDYQPTGIPKSFNGRSIQLGEFKNEIGFKEKNQVKSNLKYSLPIASIVKDAVQKELVSSGYKIKKSNLEVSGKIHSMWGQNEITFDIKEASSNELVFSQRFRTSIHHDMLLDTQAHANNLRELIDVFLRDEKVKSILQTAGEADLKPANDVAALNGLNNAIVTGKDEFLNKKKVALVIGNSNYKIGFLKNPKNDAYDIAKALRKLNFKVILEIDSTQEKMDNAMFRFGKALSAGSVGLFYYAGHGVQVNGSNYLIPVHANIKKESDVKYKALNLSVVLDEMREAQTGLNIVMIDACRDNPLPKGSRSSKRGLTRVSSPNGSIIIYSTGPGTTASDGTGRNGLFSKYLLRNISKPNLSIEKVMKNVSKQVQIESKNKQIPWIESSFTGDFYFKRK